MRSNRNGLCNIGIGTRVIRRLQLPEEAVIHSSGHAMLTGFENSGSDSGAIVKIAGHSSVTAGEKYAPVAQVDRATDF